MNHDFLVKTYHLLQNTLVKLISHYIGYSAKTVSIGKEPTLVIANHTMDYDPVLIAASIKEHCYFVASEHVFRWGLASKIIEKLFAPIVRLKGSTETRTAMQIMRTLRNGHNVCMFAEGNRCYCGVSNEIVPATGKLLRSGMANLATYRISGGYLSTPRWALTRRRGKISGELVRIYTAQELKNMSYEQINAAINADIYVDAFEHSRMTNCKYKGKRLAEGIEYAMFVCPCCSKTETIKGLGNFIYCKNCGKLAEYNDEGSFVGDKMPFKTARDWDKWQNEQLVSIVSKAEQSPNSIVFSDEAQSLYKIDKHSMSLVEKGRLSISYDELRVGNEAFKLSEISDLGICGKGQLVFNTADAQYEISSKPNCCGRKYSQFFKERRRRG